MLVIVAITFFLRGLNGLVVGTTLGCNHGGVPVFVNETFCSDNQKILTCCRDNNFDVDNQVRRDLQSLLATKFRALGESLEHGNEELTRCTNATQLISTTQGAIKRLSLFPWGQIFDVGKGDKECRRKMATFACGVECMPTPLPPLPTCPNLCLNIIRGCFHTTSEQLLLPWKYAINSIRTAIRLISNEGCDKQVLDDFAVNLNLWREPFEWLDGLCERKAGDCFEGAFGGEGLPLPSRNSKRSVAWSVNPLKYSNPEFGVNSEISEADGTLKVLREELEFVEKSLKDFWPSAPKEEDHQSDEQFYTYDEDDSESMEDFSSGSGFYGNIPTDDEDLLGGGGSGDGGISHVSVPAGDTFDITVGTASCGGRLGISLVLVLVALGI